MSFWITTRLPERVAVVPRPGWSNLSGAVRLTPRMNAATSASIARLQTIGHGAVDGFRGERRLQHVEFLVQVDHEEVQRVAAVAVDTGHVVDARHPR